MATRKKKKIGRFLKPFSEKQMKNFFRLASMSKQEMKDKGWGFNPITGERIR